MNVWLEYPELIFNGKKNLFWFDGKDAGLGMAGFIIFPILIQPDATLD